MSKRFTLIFSDETYAEIEAITERRGCTVADLIREAVNLEKWIDNATREGARLLVERDGTFREMVLLR